MSRLVACSLIVLAAWMSGAGLAAADEACHHLSCTAGDCCQERVPGCKATWDEMKTKQPRYSMRCDHACTRSFDPWHAPRPECRCCPPCGDVIVKKRLYKTDGPEEVERVPKYEVAMIQAGPCECAACRRHEPDWWHPLRTLAWILPW